MFTRLQKFKSWMRQGLAMSMLAFLAACGSTVVPTESANGYLLTVKVSSSDTQQNIAQKYGGETLAWHPEEGFAILQMTPQAVTQLKSSGASMQGTFLESLFPIATPEYAPLGWNAWAGGWNAWAGGWNAWAGGIGSITSLTTENSATWKQIGLAQGQTSAPNLGQDVKIAMIDTGIDLNHVAFSGRLGDRYDFLANTTTPQEQGAVGDPAFGHGTNVAGIVAQVAPKATLMIYRVLDKNGAGNIGNLVSAMDRAMQNGASVINLSLGSTNSSTALTTMICAAAAKKIYVVASAGNTNNMSLTYPAKQANDALTCPGLTSYLISVGSVNSSDYKSSFSNFGLSLDMTAPGEKIYSPAPGNRLAYWSGTSMAAPMVTGALALALGQGKGKNGSLKLWMVNLFGGDSIELKNILYTGQLGVVRLRVDKFLNIVQ